MTSVWKEEFFSNPGYEAGQDDPDITAIGDGRVVIAWKEDESPFNPEGADAIVAQILDALGNPIGGPFGLSGSLLGEHSNVDLAPRIEDGFVAVFEVYDGADTSILMATFDADGLEVGPPQVIAKGPMVDDPDIALGLDGNYAIAFEDSTGVKMSIVDVNGQTGPAITVHDGPSTSVVRVDTLANGSFLVGFSTVIDGNPNDAVGYAVVNPGTAQVSTVFTGQTDEVQFQPEVAGLAGGGFVVTYRTIGAEKNSVIVQVFDQTGARIKGPFDPNPTTNHTMIESLIVPLPDGGFIVSWSDSGAELALGRRYDSSGDPMTEVFVIGGAGGLPLGQVGTVLEDGRVLLGFQETVSETNLFAGSIFDFRDNIIIGSDGDDILTSKVAGAIVKGKKGKDTLIGLEAQDRLFGNKGEDVLIGDRGNDFLKGGKKADQFVFSTELNKKTNVDEIADFNRKKGDTIVLLDDIFGAVGTTVNKGEFVKAKKAKDDNDFIIFKKGKSENKLFYDADGKGGDDKVLFATLDSNVKRKDFEVIDDLVI